MSSLVLLIAGCKADDSAEMRQMTRIWDTGYTIPVTSSGWLVYVQRHFFKSVQEKVFYCGSGAEVRWYGLFAIVYMSVDHGHNSQLRA